jgi:hypothetical protein
VAQTIAGIAFTVVLILIVAVILRFRRASEAPADRWLAFTARGWPSSWPWFRASAWGGTRRTS